MVDLPLPVSPTRARVFPPVARKEMPRRMGLPVTYSKKTFSNSTVPLETVRVPASGSSWRGKGPVTPLNSWLPDDKSPADANEAARSRKVRGNDSCPRFGGRGIVTHEGWRC